MQELVNPTRVNIIITSISKIAF